MTNQVCPEHGNAGSNNGMWKGDEVGYKSLHQWIKDHKPKPRSCQKCHAMFVSLDLANISGEYRRDINDFEWLCRACHMKSDGRLNQLIERNRKPQIRLRNEKGQYVARN